VDGAVHNHNWRNSSCPKGCAGRPLRIETLLRQPFGAGGIGRRTRIRPVRVTRRGSRVTRLAGFYGPAVRSESSPCSDHPRGPSNSYFEGPRFLSPASRMIHSAEGGNVENLWTPGRFLWMVLCTTKFAENPCGKGVARSCRIGIQLSYARFSEQAGSDGERGSIRRGDSPRQPVTRFAGSYGPTVRSEPSHRPITREAPQTHTLRGLTHFSVLPCAGHAGKAEAPNPARRLRSLPKATRPSAR
jgi:hypothetical protein